MELWVTLCLLGVLGTIVSFVTYFISRGLKMDDSRIIDPLPANDPAIKNE